MYRRGFTIIGLLFWFSTSAWGQTGPWYCNNTPGLDLITWANNAAANYCGTVCTGTPVGPGVVGPDQFNNYYCQTFINQDPFSCGGGSCGSGQTGGTTATFANGGQYVWGGLAFGEAVNASCPNGSNCTTGNNDPNCPFMDKYWIALYPTVGTAGAISGTCSKNPSFVINNKLSWWKKFWLNMH